MTNIDEKLVTIDEFNKSFKTYVTMTKELQEWLLDGRKRMDSLLKPEKNLLPEERVMYTMELQSDIEDQIKKFGQQQEMWQSLKPTTDAESSDESQVWKNYFVVITKPKICLELRVHRKNHR